MSSWSESWPTGSTANRAALWGSGSRRPGPHRLALASLRGLAAGRRVTAEPTAPPADRHDLLDLAKAAAEAAADRQATDVVLLDLQGMGGFADYFVICTGATERQRQAVADAVEASAATMGAGKVQREGSAASGWLLLDLGGGSGER